MMGVIQACEELAMLGQLVLIVRRMKKKDLKVKKLFGPQIVTLTEDICSTKRYLNISYECHGLENQHELLSFRCIIVNPSHRTAKFDVDRTQTIADPFRIFETLNTTVQQACESFRDCLSVQQGIRS